MTWIQSHLPLIISVAGALYTLLSIVNGAIQAPRAKTWIGYVLDALSYIKRAGADGSVKLPFTKSCPKDALPPTAGTIVAGPVAMLLPLLFLVAVGLAGCAGAKIWSSCTLGQLPAIAQPLIPEIIQDLGGVSETVAIQQIEQLGSALAPGQLACIVQAVVADVSAKAALSDQGKRIVANGNAFLAKHPACCVAAKK